jgi:hypothetical protein
MTGRHRPAWAAQVTAGRWMARTAVAALSVSVSLMVALGIAGPRAGKATFSPAPPWPPWFVHAHPSPVLWSISLGLAEVAGGGGLALALLAARQGWRPAPRCMIFGCVVAVIALTLIPPVDNGDPLYYAAYGRIAVLGHSPYVPKPVQWMPVTDPVRLAVPIHEDDPPSRYGPVATATEAAASELAGDSPARTDFWLKVWNALAFLGLVAALDRAVRSDAARRVRAHLLWSLNPLMLFAVLGNGHNDVLAAAAGTSALLVMRRIDSGRGLLAGLLLGIATAIRTPYALFGVGLAWCARRQPRVLTVLSAGLIGVLVSGYLIAGRAAISATTTGLASGEHPDVLWHEAAGLLGWQHALARTNTLGMLGCAALALILLWRMPPGPRDFPAVRISLALALGLLIAAPLQMPSYDAMFFPLLAVFPVTRLDWIAVAHSAALTTAAAPFLTTGDPSWLTVIERISIGGSPTLVLAVIVGALLWLCLTRDWQPGPERGGFLIESASRGAGGIRSPTR